MTMINSIILQMIGGIKTESSDLHKFSDIRIKYITRFIRKYHKIDALTPLKNLIA